MEGELILSGHGPAGVAHCKLHMGVITWQTAASLDDHYCLTY